MLDLPQHDDTPTSQMAHEQAWVAYLLAWSAAFCDAIGFLSLQQLGASFMSGNSMVTGVALGQMHWASLVNHGLPILSFAFGLAIGLLLILQVKAWHIRPCFSFVFALEFLCILAFILLGSFATQQRSQIAPQSVSFYLCTILLTLSMGLQTATIKKVANQSARTTFVTGVISDIVTHAVTYLTWLHAQVTQHTFRQTLHLSQAHPSLRNLLLLIGIWVCYVFGAACGSALQQRFSFIALVIPLLVLVGLIIIDILRPLDE